MLLKFKGEAKLSIDIVGKFRFEYICVHYTNYKIMLKNRNKKHDEVIYQKV